MNHIHLKRILIYLQDYLEIFNLLYFPIPNRNGLI